MVQFKDVSKIYPGNIPSVSNINFAIKEGEFVFLIGPSGSGKTTLLKMLIRDEKPSRGKIFFDDQDITNISRSKIYHLRRRVGVIFQDFKLIGDKTAYENVAFAMEAAGKPSREIKERVPYVLDIVGLSHRLSSFPRQLSGGEQQRVAIARALANNPKILIADEPTGNLDPASAWDIVQILTKINNWGTTVIMSTHGTDIVNSLNKRVIQMENGTMLRDDNKGEYEFTQKFESKVLSEENPESAVEKNETPKKTIKVNLTSKIKDNIKQEKELEAPEPKKGILRKALFFIPSIKQKKAETQDEPKVTESANFEENIVQDEEDFGEIHIDIKTKEVKELSPESNKNLDDTKAEDHQVHLNLDLQSTAEEDIASEKKQELVNTKEKTKNKKEEKKSKKNTKQSKTKSEATQTESSMPSEEPSQKDLNKIYVQELEIPNHVKADLISAGFGTLKEIVDFGPEKLADDLIVDSEEVILIAKAIEKILNN